MNETFPEISNEPSPLWLRLGASMYVPSTRGDLLDIANGEKHPSLRSVIFCTEDAILAEDVDAGMDNLADLLAKFTPHEKSPLVFVRVRNIDILERLRTLPGAEKLTGVVIPKVTSKNIQMYMNSIMPTPWRVMLTLETAETFDREDSEALRRVILLDAYKGRVLSLRIGGNDLLNVLHLRRSRHRTSYDSPLGGLIDQLVLTYKPSGFNLSAPVYEHMDEPSILSKEVEKDLAHGLFGKTVIHPNQISTVESQYKVSSMDVEAARAILAKDAPAVFKLHGSMCEPATHRNWAKLTLHRATLYGIHDSRDT